MAHKYQSYRQKGSLQIPQVLCLERGIQPYAETQTINGNETRDAHRV